MSAPLIGLTTYGRNEINHYSLPAEYLESVRRAGGIPVLIGPGESRLPELLSHLDALILTGGGDIDPALYEGTPHESIYMIDQERDHTELALFREAVSTEIPILGICRGIQTINVALGGTLHEHLPDVVGSTVLHRKPPLDTIPHEVLIAKSSRLSAILGKTRVTILSWHHQAVETVAPPLQVVAHAPDGVIEAVEHPDHPWLLAVQWHPELTSANDAIQQQLFDAVVQAALDYRSSPP